MKAGIRARLLVLVVGVAVPIAYVGLVGIWAMWNVSRQQLDDSIENQAEIAGAAFEQWINAQREPLATVAARYAEHKRVDPEFLNTFRLSVTTRQHWLGLHIVNAEGETLASQPRNAPSLQPGIVDGLVRHLRGREWAIDTDWSRGTSSGVLMISIPLADNMALVAQLDVTATSESFLRRVNLSDQAVFSVFGPQRRIILYRNATSETYLGKDMSDSALLVALADRPTTVIELTSPIDQIRRVYGLARAGDTECVAMVGVPSETLYGTARNQFIRHLTFTIAGLLLAMLGALLIARRIAGPVRQLNDAARRFGAGDTSARATVQATGELEDLRTSFNAMASEIEQREARLTELDRLKSDFVSGVSHEMRTPLTTIKTLTSVLLRENSSDAERLEFLRTIMSECDRQIDLVLNLLDLSRIEAGTFNITLMPVDAAEVVRSCAETERRNAEARHHRLEIRLPDEPAKVLADRAALRRLVCGLVQNAIKYTPDGGRIVISTVRSSGEVRISVSDNGRGIREEDTPHIFEKFYRGTPAHDPGTDSIDEESSDGDGAPGVGLGLYLARIIVEEIGGHISVRSKVGEGSIFTVKLPSWDNNGRPENAGRHG
jgi:signal transduction histidine kinase